MKTILTFVVGIFAAHISYASAPIETPVNPLWSCDLAFNAVGEGFQVLVGEYFLEGNGVIKCVGQSRLAEIPVKVTMQASPLSRNISIGHIKVNGNASNVSLYTMNPEALIGNYAVTQANFAIGAGVGMFTGTKINSSDVVLPISLRLLKGLGINFGITNMQIERLTQ